MSERTTALSRPRPAPKPVLFTVARANRALVLVRKVVADLVARHRTLVELKQERETLHQELTSQETLDAVSQGAARSWMLSHRGPQVLNRDWRPRFTIDLQQKDLRLVLEAADQMGVPSLATSTVFNLYRTLQAQGLGGDGNHALVKALENLAGVQVAGGK